MHLRRTAIIAAVLCTLSVSAGAVEVFDPLNTLEHSFLNGWRESIGAVLTQQLDRVRQMAKRLSAVTSLAKYVAPDAPLWRTRRIDDALAASDAFMDALNGGDQTGRGYAAVARSRVPVGSAFAEFGEENVVAENALRAALATLDIADSVIMAGTDQTGRIRGNRRSEVNTIAALESDVIDGNQEQSTTRRARQNQRGEPDSGATARDAHGAADRAHRAAARRFKARPRHRSRGDEHAAGSSEPRSSRGGELAGGLGGRFSLLASTVTHSGERPCLQNHV